MIYDAVVVLAGGVNEDGSLPEVAASRVERGIDLLTDKTAPVIIFSGHYTFLKPNSLNLSESDSMKSYAINRGVLPESILVEDKSKDTLGNAYFLKTDIFAPKMLKNFIVVTSDFHIERTKYLFQKVFGPEYKIDYESVPSNVNGTDLEQKQLVLSHQWLDTISDGDDKIIGSLLFTKHPGYAPNPEISVEQLLKSLK